MTRSQEFWSSGGAEVRLRDVVLTEVLYPAGLQMPAHWHEPAYLSCVLEGSYEEKVGRSWRNVERRSMIAHPREEEHAVRFGAEGARILSIRLGEETLDLFRGEAEPVPFEGWRQSSESDRVAARIRSEMRRGGQGSRLALEGLVLQLLASGVRLKRPRPGPRSVRRAQEYIRENFTLPLTLQEVGLASGVHPVYLAKAFQRHTGLSVGEFIRALRVERARESIIVGELSLGQIALECGFADQPHFTRTFKGQMGVTPSEFRSSLRKD